MTYTQILKKVLLKSTNIIKIAVIVLSCIFGNTIVSSFEQRTGFFVYIVLFSVNMFLMASIGREILTEYEINEAKKKSDSKK